MVDTWGGNRRLRPSEAARRKALSLQGSLTSAGPGNGGRPTAFGSREAARREGLKTAASDRSWPILLKNSVREIERETLKKPTSQIGSGATIATSRRVGRPPKTGLDANRSSFSTESAI